MQITNLSENGATLASQVASSLQEYIIKGELKPGERLYQDTIAKQIGVSRIPVRLAFEMLQSRGFITLQPHKGAKVSELSIEELKDIFTIRAFIEEMAIEKSLPNLTTEDLELCEQYINQMKVINDSNLWLEMNKKFHQTLNSHIESQTINNLIKTLRENTERYVRIALIVIDRFEAYDEEHLEILLACKEKNVEKAKECVRKHLESTVSALEEYLSSKEV